MSLEETTPFDPAIWAPDLLGTLIKNAVGQGRISTSSASTWWGAGKFEPLTDENKLKHRRVLSMRQQTPNDWIICERDALLVRVATCWIECHDKTRTPEDFCSDIFLPLSLAVLTTNNSNELIELLTEHGVIKSCVINTDFCSLVEALLAWFYVTAGLESGNIKQAVNALVEVSIALGRLEHSAERRQSAKKNKADQESKSRRAFAQLGAAAKHKKNDAHIAKVLEHFAEYGHMYSSKEKAAAEMAGNLVPRSERTIGKWLIGLTPRHLKPGKVPR